MKRLFLFAILAFVLGWRLGRKVGNKSLAEMPGGGEKI
jgi:hypothetical protein